VIRGAKGNEVRDGLLLLARLLLFRCGSPRTRDSTTQFNLAIFFPLSSSSVVSPLPDHLCAKHLHVVGLALDKKGDWSLQMVDVR
jgi:hypothetical protein